MKLWWRILATAVIAVASVTTGQMAQMQNDVVTASVDRIELVSVTSERVQFNVMTHVTASRKLQIKRVRFEDMHLEDTPIYLSPIEEHLDLDKGVSRDLPPIPLTLYLRDAHSLDGLEQVVRDGKATMRGQARLDLDLSLIDRAATGQWTVRADMPVEMTVPVDVPGGAPGRLAAVTTLSAAQAALRLSNAGFGILNRSRLQSEDELRTQYAPSIVLAESHYSLRMLDKGRVDFVVRGLGIRLSKDGFAITDETLEPWKYDTDTVTALKTKSATLIADSCDLLVWPAETAMDASTARSLSGRQIQIVSKSNHTERTLVPVGKDTVEIIIARRDSDQNFAILRFTRPEDEGTAVSLASEETRHGDRWDPLTLFRLDSKGKLQILSLPAHRDGKRIAFEEPVDDSAFGSLLIASDGVLGMVQDERSGVILRGQ